jgi:hypothetical protein
MSTDYEDDGSEVEQNPALVPDDELESGGEVERNPALVPDGGVEL